MDPEETFGRGKLNERIDPERLVDRIALDEAEVSWRKTFIGFDEEDERRLSDLEPVLRENQERIADDFYEAILEYERTQSVIGRSPKGVGSLKQTQRAYLVSLATGSYDLDYFHNRARIGKLHEMIDMPLHFYVGQYGVYYDLLLERLNDRVQNRVVDAVEEWANERDDTGGGLGGLASALGLGGSDDPTLEESFETTVRDAIDDGMMDVLSLLRIINLDMQVAADTYVDSYAQRLERSIERRKRLAREVEHDVRRPIEELHEASEVVAGRAETISGHTASQASAVDAVAGDLSEVSAAVEEIAAAAGEVHADSERTERLAAEGVGAADEAIADLEELEAVTDRAATAADTLEAKTDEIDAVLDRLEGVAERTAILAKNAKIEASRSDSEDAGPMRVIAEEVDSFASQTRSDLEAIEDAVLAVREEAAETASATEQTVERVDDGTEHVHETIASLEEIHESAQATASSMEDVAVATDQQARNVERAATTVDDVAQTADQVAAAAESVAAASEEQTASLQDVVETVSRLTDEENGATETSQ
ncbi:globin-coupled sensor protein [Natrarchaeobaculum sulfurireducens]|uniref:Heme-based aerotactic transducer HemAT n=1 Tax=Natrarchaeobaculum sulfurireducens TaxID=2044521 RepID=A0A346PL09_9EURY|nr:globin-coupled sensor protein [Natrarchaeobaculum sulfurireducens]AXR80204.1 heme-based aerotactic transducer HemAT [Natrarchaeobaculum sulfurireducens]